MKNLKRKGFTIVELVIVIAVIAVLAAVLIPTFSNVIKKANMSVDQVAVKNMNTALSVEVLNKPKDRLEALKILSDAGFETDSLIPETENYRFYWNTKYNKILLVDITDEDNKIVVYPENIEEIVEDFNQNPHLSYDLSMLLPSAKVEDLSSLTVMSNFGNQTLDTGVTFIALEEEASPEYKDWIADFTISFDRDFVLSNVDENTFEVLNPDGIALFLAGQYESFSEDWLAFPAYGYVEEINAREEIRVIAAADFEFTYDFICSTVKEFSCGIKILPGANVDLTGTTVTLDLRIYEPVADGETGRSFAITTYTYTYGENE